MKAKLKKIVNAVAAAFTTPDAIKEEKAFGVFVVVRVVIALGGTAATADGVLKLVQAFSGS